MPTANPRVNVTLSPALFSLVTRLADLQRSSKSDVLRELLEAAAPSLERAAALMDAASRAKPEVLRGMALTLERSQERLEAYVQGVFDGVEAQPDLVDQAQAVKPRRPARTGGVPAAPGGTDSTRRSRGRARSALPAPPPSNRGGK